MADTKEKPRVDIQEVFRSYSRRLLSDFWEGEKAANLAFDRGLPRENALRKFFQQRLPGRYGVDEGLVFDTTRALSQQCDIVIYDRERTPILSTEQAMKIWPFESVYAVAQVKSRLTKTALEEAVDNIRSFKKLSRKANTLAGARGFYTVTEPRNQPIGMLIAHDFDDGFLPEQVEPILKSVEKEHQIDAYCVLSGRVGFRGTEQADAVIIGDPSGDTYFEDDHGDGALAAFLLLSTAVLNSIDLTGPNFFAYSKFLDT